MGNEAEVEWNEGNLHIVRLFLDFFVAIFNGVVMNFEEIYAALKTTRPNLRRSQNEFIEIPQFKTSKALSHLMQKGKQA